MDGVTVGHPRCNVEHCTEPLATMQQRFCPSHSKYENLCAIKGCQQPPEKGFRTCPEKTHRDYEQELRQRGQALFRLKARLQARSTAAALRTQPSEDAGADSLDHPDAAVEFEDLLPSNARPKPATKTKSTMKASLTRRWTHNEQLIVRCCGVIIARATFYEAESVSNALVCFHHVPIVMSPLITGAGTVALPLGCVP